MNCPKCQALMEKVTYEGIEVDRCTSCRGIWFEALEHEKLKSKQGAAPAIDTGTPPADAGEVRKLNCPVCTARMISMVVRGNAALRYESCTVCYGAFFDAGEFTQYDHETGRVLRGLVGLS